jgi:hypothetical protein
MAASTLSCCTRALYYLAQPQAFVAEARRVLRPDGRLVLCTVNREWADFNPSPFSTVYHSAAELRALLEGGGFDTTLFAAFPAQRATTRDRAVSAVKRFAVAFGLVPKTMRGKRLLKRVFLGRLVSFSAGDSRGHGRLSRTGAGKRRWSRGRLQGRLCDWCAVTGRFARLATRYRRPGIIVAQGALAALSNYFAFLLRFDGGPIPEVHSARF